MQALVKELLALTAESDAAKWSEFEANLKPSELKPNNLAQVALHFAECQKGSQAFWSAVEESTSVQLDQFTSEDIFNITAAFMSTEYDVSKESEIVYKQINQELGQQITKGLLNFYEQDVQKQMKKDPYYLHNLYQYWDAKLTLAGLPALGPSFQNKGTIAKNDWLDTEFEVDMEDQYTTEQIGLINYQENKKLTAEDEEYLQKVEQNLNALRKENESYINIKDLLGWK